MSTELDITCDDFESDAPGLALDQLSDPRRTILLEHAATCSRCSELLRDLCEVSDRLLELAPRVEPPTGFESRAVARMAASRPRRSRRAAVATVAVAAALLLLVAGVAIGRSSGRGDTSVAAGAIVTDDGMRIGTAELERTGRSRIVLTMDGPSSWEGIWTCELFADDRWTEVGTWTADQVTNHVWAAGVDDSLADATEMRIIGDSGAVVATAVLVGS